MRRFKWAGLAAVIATMAVAIPARADQTVTVFPQSPPNTGNCYPFGVGDVWTPYTAFFYQDIPAFELRPGDIIAFDTNAVNNADIQLEIALARTTTNGGTEEAQPFQTVVTNTQTPLNPRGDTVVGNFELQFRAEAAFSFPGGGLIIRFSNPSASYAADVTCTGNLVAGAATDSSGFFLRRAYADPDGVAPWDVAGPDKDEDIGAFQIRTFDPPPPTVDCQGTTTPSTTGTEGDDNLVGTANHDAIFGLGGNDELDGVDGDDCLDGGEGDDRASGGADNDLVKGGDGRDKVRGLGGKDRLKGQGGVDRLNGGEGRDRLSGGRGADKLRGGAAKDVYKGNAGDDTLNAVDAKRDRVNCGAGDDKAVVDPVDRVSRNCETVREVEKD